MVFDEHIFLERIFNDRDNNTAGPAVLTVNFLTDKTVISRGTSCLTIFFSHTRVFPEKSQQTSDLMVGNLFFFPSSPRAHGRRSNNVLPPYPHAHENPYSHVASTFLTLGPTRVEITRFVEFRTRKSTRVK